MVPFRTRGLLFIIGGTRACMRASEVTSSGHNLGAHLPIASVKGTVRTRHSGPAEQPIGDDSLLARIHQLARWNKPTLPDLAEGQPNPYTD